MLKPVHAATLLPIILATSFVATACSSGSPAAPSPAGLGGPGAAERRVGAVGGSEGACPEEEPECFDGWGTFTLTVPNGDTLVGSFDELWVITGGTGRYATAGGFAEFSSGADYVNTLFNFDTSHDSPPVYTEGRLILTSSAEQPSTDCTSGSAVRQTYSGVLESFGRVTLELNRCSVP